LFPAVANSGIESLETGQVHGGVSARIQSSSLQGEDFLGQETWKCLTSYS